MIDIFRVTGGTETVLCRVADSSASVVNELMGREEVTVNVVVESPLPVEVGDFVRIDTTVYTLNREPDFEKVSDVEYRYNLLFESPLYRMLDKLFTNPLTGISKFSVSRTLSEFVRLLTENMNKIDSGWSVSGDIPASEPKNLTFDAVSCREVLNRLSGEFGAEYFLTGKTIHFTERIENKTDLVFEQGKGKGLYSIGQEPVDSENTVTRIFPYGGTQNMTPGKGDASGRLFLPEGYLENFTEYSKVVEKEVEFQDVFPRFTGSADSVSGEFNNVIRCSSINFDVEKQGVGDTKIKINFLSGDLMGETFEFGWNNTNKEVTLIRKEDETALPGKDGKRPLIPHALKKAKSGDSFNFTDLLMPDEYMASAIVDLRAKATEWLSYYSRSRVKYSLEVDHRYLRGKRTLKAGDLVTIKIPETGTEKLLRIVSAERNLNTGKLSCTVSNYLDEKWSKKIEGAISDLKSNVTGSGSGGGLKIDILKENDLTPASDLNIYSSKRSVKEIGDRLSRVKADSSAGHITFKKGITVEGGTVTDTLTASGKVVAPDMEAGNNIKSKTAEVSEKSVAGTLQVKGIATATDMEIANHVKTKTVEVTGKAQAGDLEVTGNAKLNSLNVSGKAVTGTIDVAGLSKSGNSEVVNLSQTKDLEVAELARIRDLVVTRLAEVLNLSVTDVATLARTIVKESISSETFIPGFAGEGFKIWQLAGGDWTGEFDSITIRKTLTAFELLISKIRAVKGSLAITQANGKIKKVLDQSPVYSLEIDETMSFTIGDLVRCQTWQSTVSKYYWVTVVRVEGNSIICNKAEFNGVVPSVGDELVQMGHVSDASRQSMVYLDASSGRPSIDVLSGINTKSFAGKLKVRLGCLDGITDTDFPSDMQPSGYGLYCTNGFFKGMFVLQSGKTVEDYAGGLVDAIQVGVRNLVKNSVVNMTSNIYGFGHRWLTKYLEPGKTYTLVANGRVDEQTLADNKHLLVVLYNQGWNQFKELTFDSLADETKQITFTLSKTAPVPTAISSFLYPADGGRTGKVTINWYMLFEGNKAPESWMEAPEDTAEKIQAAQDEANRANGAITRIDTELSALPGEITAAVTKTTTAYTDDKIADIQIGGVNLLINSAVERHGSVGLEYLNLFDPTTVFDRLGVGTYTISFDAKSAIEGNMHFYSTPGVVANFKYVFKTVNGVDVTTNGIFGVNFDVTTEYKRYVFVVEIMGSNPASAISSVSLYGFYNSGKIPYVKNIKFEQGNKATGWSPAPEDSAAALKSVRTELDSRLTVTERDITQKVSQSDFNALGQRVGTAEASIKTQSDKIALTVTKEEFDNLQIGTKNLLLNSKGPFTGNSGKYGMVAFTQSANMVQGKQYTIVLRGKSTAPDGIGFWISGTYFVQQWKSAEDTTWSHTFTASGGGFVSLYHKPLGGAGETTVYWCMLFEGNKAPTEYQPAPEDTNTKISEMEGRFEVREDLISAKVTEVARKAMEASNSATSAIGSAETAAAKAGEALGSANLAANSYQAVVVKQSEINQTAGNITLQVTEVTEKSAAAINAAELAAAMSKGKMLYRDPTFKEGRNGITPYNNSGNPNLAITRGSGLAGNPNTSGYHLQIATTGVVAPALGGFTFLTPTRANAIFVMRFIAKIPVGGAMWFAHNSMGDGSSFKWLTSNISTGNWEEYAVKVKCGSSGVFHSTNFIYIIEGGVPFTWYLSYATVFDVTDVDDVPTRDEIKSGIEIVPGGMKVFGENHDFSGKFTFSSFSQETQAVINGKATPNDITSAVNNYNNTIIEGGHIKTGLIEGANLNFTKGTIGGFNINTYSVFAGGIYPNAGIEMTKAGEVGRFLVGRGQEDYCMLYNYNATQWGITGAKDGVVAFHLGAYNQIAGWNFDNEAIFAGDKAADGTYATSGMTIRSNGSISSKNFRIDKDGNVFGKNCEFTDGRFMGVVTATSGKIGGFALDEDRMGTKDGDEGMSLYNNFIKFKYREKQARLGSSVLSASSGGSLLCSLKNESSNYSANICLELSAKNGVSNYAINMLSGCIAGLAINSRFILGSGPLYDTDVFVCANQYNTSDPTYQLPPNPTVGKVIITCNSNKAIIVSGNGRMITANGSNISSLKIAGYDKMAIFIYDGECWRYNYFNN